MAQCPSVFTSNDLEQNRDGVRDGSADIKITGIVILCLNVSVTEALQATGDEIVEGISGHDFSVIETLIVLSSI